MILLLALSALADPVAQRSPARGDVVAVVGAPHQSIGWRPRGGGTDLMLSASVRLPSAATDLSVGTRITGGPLSRDEHGWGWTFGTSTGLVLTRGPGAALSVHPWARIERLGRIHGGAQIAAPMSVGGVGGRARIPVLGELFLGSQRGAWHVAAVGGAGWAWVTDTPAGALLVQGTVQVGIRPGRARLD